MNSNQNTEPLARSDDLADIIELFKEDGPFYFLREILQISLILDANIALGTLYWLVKTRKDPTARTSLLEVLDAGTLKAYAPTYLNEEIEKNLPVMAQRERIVLNELRIQWEKFKLKIEFVDMGGADPTYSDPKDAPYLKLQEMLGHSIVSDDSDMERMGGKVVHKAILTRLRSYSRKAAVEYSLKIAGYGAITLSASLLRTTSAFLASLFGKVSKLPQWVLAIALGIIIVMLASPRSRERFKNLFLSLNEKSKSLSLALLEEISPLLIEHASAKDAADETRESIVKELSRSINSTAGEGNKTQESD